MSLSIKATGFNEAATGLLNIAKTVKPNIIAQTNEIVDEAYNQARSDCPVRTGHLKSTIELKKGDGAQVIVQIIVGASYAQPVNFGTFRMPPRPFATNAYYYIISELKRINIAKTK